jgi:hypothetical protein
VRLRLRLRLRFLFLRIRAVGLFVVFPLFPFLVFSSFLFVSSDRGFVCIRAIAFFLKRFSPHLLCVYHVFIVCISCVYRVLVLSAALPRCEHNPAKVAAVTRMVLVWGYNSQKKISNVE